MTIGEFAVRRLYAKGKLSLNEIADAYITVFPCPWNDSAGYRPEILQGLTEDLDFWLALDPTIYRPPLSWEKNPVLVPAGSLTSRQADTLHRWMKDRDDFHWMDVLPGQTECDADVLDSIQWKFGAGWRNKYSTKSIPHRG
jgi:hypothetical protein